MILKTLIGIAVLLAGLALALAGFRHPDMTWFVAGCLVSFLGLLLIRRRRRDRRMRGAVDDDPGDFGDLDDLSDWNGAHHSSGGHSSDHLELPSIDFDD
jgi:ABC-type nickel/cobalt efflux system permease component RcnA